ncbi:hypothetical protein TrLO_g6981, partial [Triparma laevis f. longispina]
GGGGVLEDFGTFGGKDGFNPLLTDEGGGGGGGGDGGGFGFWDEFNRTSSISNLGIGVSGNNERDSHEASEMLFGTGGRKKGKSVWKRLSVSGSKK